MSSLCQQLEPLTRDARVGAVHISLYVALLQVREEQGGVDPFFISRREVMRKAKIKGVSTYYIAIRELYRYGFVEYGASKDRRGRSVVSLFAT